MELLHGLVDVVLHLDRHLVELLEQHGLWLYAILFAIIFAETGFVVTPFLPGDSLLFAAGALAAVDTSGTLRLGPLLLLLAAAAIAGNSLNYTIGRYVGPRAFTADSRLLRLEHLQRTEAFFRRHGALAIVLSRFVPIVRTFAPFVAGIGRMPYARFQTFNVAGGAGWVLLCCVGGYLFGNLPWVKQHFGLVTIAIIIVSVVPLALTIARERFAGR
ncbi:MAG: DedA family protein [Gammaproteobacteria bacterium]|nr:DedA family protein [Gammaproteobacteria bacterium]